MASGKDIFRKIGDRFASRRADICLVPYLEQDEKYAEALQLWDEHQEALTELGIEDGIVHALHRKAKIALKRIAL